MNGMEMMMKALGIDPEAILKEFKVQIGAFETIATNVDTRITSLDLQVAQLHQKLDLIMRACGIEPLTEIENDGRTDAGGERLRIAASG